MQQMLFIDDRPCGARRPCSFNDKLFERPDVLPILVRFAETFDEFSDEYLALTQGFPTFYVTPGKTAEEEAKKLTQWCRELELKPTSYCCMSEPQQEFGNQLAISLGLPALPQANVHALRHKPTMKSWLRNVSLRTADYLVVDKVDDVIAFGRTVGYPIVLKPCAGFGTLRTHLIEEEGQVWAHRDQIEGAEETMVESFIADEEIQCCALISRGKVMDTFVSLTPAAPLAIANGAISANISIGRFKSRFAVDFNNYTQQIIDCFGLNNGYLHMEWFVSRETGCITIGECALRYPGCEIAKNHGLAYGFDIADLTVDLYLGHSPLACYTGERCVGDLLLPYRDGHVTAISTRQELERLPGVLEVHLGVEIGEELPAVPPSSFNCSGWVFVEGETPEEVNDRMHKINKAFVLETMDVVNEQQLFKDDA